MISGEKVVLKGITKESANEIYEWVNHEDLRPLTGTVYPVSVFEHEEWIKRQVTRQDRKLFLIADKETGSNIGTIGLKNFDWLNRNVELFVCIAKNLKNSQRGYGTDAVTTLVKYCFYSLNLHKVYLHVFESNTRAIRCYEKAGMSREGNLIDQHFQNGKYENVLVLGIVNSS